MGTSPGLLRQWYVNKSSALCHERVIESGTHTADEVHVDDTCISNSHKIPTKTVAHEKYFNRPRTDDNIVCNGIMFSKLANAKIACTPTRNSYSPLKWNNSARDICRSSDEEGGRRFPKNVLSITVINRTAVC